MSPFRLNPSAIARAFFHDCQRFLYRRTASPETRAREGIPEVEGGESPLMQAVLDSGYDWERAVVTEKLAGRVEVADGEGPLHERQFSAAESEALLRGAPAGRFIYQARLRATPLFYEEAGLDRGLVFVTDSHADLIEVLDDGEGRRLFRVIDVKRGRSLQLTHRVQILLYAWLLDAQLRALGIADARADLSAGAVWLGGAEAPELFDLEPVRPIVASFLRESVPAVLRAPEAEANWHITTRCELCEWFPRCRAEMQREDDLSRLPLITSRAKVHLRSAGVRRLSELRLFLEGEDAGAVLSRCASLAGRRHQLGRLLEAHEREEPRAYEAAAPSLPKREDIAVFLTLQHEPLGMRLYMAGLLIHCGQEILRELFPKKARPEPDLLVAERPEEVAELERRFVRWLHELLTRVERRNSRVPRAKQYSLQVYVHNDKERERLEDLLLRALDHEATGERAASLLLYFQSAELILSEKHPDRAIPFPLVNLDAVLRRLLALPIEVNTTLPEVLAVLGGDQGYPRDERFHFPLGHGLRSDMIHGVWQRGETEDLAAIREQGALTLLALRGLLWRLRYHARRHIHARPPRFRLPQGLGFRDPLLSKLAFFARYESLLRCAEKRSERARPEAVQRDLGRVILLEALDATRFKVLTPGHELGDDGFPKYLLVKRSREGRRSQLLFSDYRARGFPTGYGSDPHLAIVGIKAVTVGEDGFAEDIALKYGRRFEFEQPEAGDRLMLYERFTDFNTDRVLDHLKALEDRGRVALVDQLRDPSATGERALPTPVQARVAEALQALSLTASQGAALAAILRRELTLVWGPPGTGKTHFLASLILAMATAYRRAGQRFRVLVTAFTHAAIENALRKVDELGRCQPGLVTPDLVKAKGYRSAGARPGLEREDRAVEGWLARQDCAVVGATVYSAMKWKDSAFDLVVIDEASQLRIPESLVPLSLVASGGRAVLAGDDLQLPPIIAGRYPEPPEGEPVLHRSIFEALRSREAESAPVTWQLQENFRMNATLTGVAAQLLYGPGYRCFDESIAARRLRLTDTDFEEPLLKLCLAPEASLVLVVLEDVPTTAESVAEAELTAGLVTALRERMLDETGRAFDDDERFFDRGLFVVSPHHAQIRLIRSALARRRTWSSPPVVGTVDTIQGQEAEAVVVSYGVSDPEKALLEAEFIYDRNRLNVAMTRARSKTVILLSRALLEASPQVLNYERAMEGLAFMRGLEELLVARGQERRLEASGHRVCVHWL